VLDVAHRVDVRAPHEAHVGIEGVRRPVAPVGRPWMSAAPIVPSKSPIVDISNGRSGGRT
jgi:hypothetical protein